MELLVYIVLFSNKTFLVQQHDLPNAIKIENEENKYWCYFEWMQDKVVYVKPCPVTPVGSNTKR
jgi:hypothetical protein